jgi:flagellar biosynthesis component FlhA
VASEEAESSLGSDLVSQIFGQPRALKVAALFVLLLAATPGLPGLPFLVIGGLLFAASRSELRPRSSSRGRALGAGSQRRPR